MCISGGTYRFHSKVGPERHWWTERHWTPPNSTLGRAVQCSAVSPSFFCSKTQPSRCTASSQHHHLSSNAQHLSRYQPTDTIMVCTCSSSIKHQAQARARAQAERTKHKQRNRQLHLIPDITPANLRSILLFYLPLHLPLHLHLPLPSCVTSARHGAPQ